MSVDANITIRHFDQAIRCLEMSSVCIRRCHEADSEVSESSDEHEVTADLNALEKATLETKSKDRKEVAECSSSDENDPSIEELNELIEVKVIRKPLEETIVKNSQTDSSLYGDHMQLLIQPSGKLIVSDALDAKYIMTASRLMPRMDQSRECVGDQTLSSQSQRPT